MYILCSYGNEPQNAVRGKCLLRNTMLIQCCISHFLLHLLSDPSPIIGYACYSLTHSLLFSKLDACVLYWTRVNLIDVTLACEDANSKLVEVVTVADVDSEDHVGNSLLQTRSYAALRAADLDWIVGPGYSLGRVHSGKKTMKNQPGTMKKP